MGYTRPTPIQAEAIPVVPRRPRPDRLRLDRHRQDGGVPPPDPPAPARRVGARQAPRARPVADARAGACRSTSRRWRSATTSASRRCRSSAGSTCAPQERALRAGAEIVVATPGRLLDHMRFGYVDFAALEVLVLDEADRMLDMGFLPDIRRILDALPKRRQTLMFSATMAARDPQARRRHPRRPRRRHRRRRRSRRAGSCRASIRWRRSGRPRCSRPCCEREAMTSVLVFVKRKSDADQLRARGHAQRRACHQHPLRPPPGGSHRGARGVSSRRVSGAGRDRRRGARARRRGHLAHRQLRRAVLVRRLHPSRRSHRAGRRRRRGRHVRRRRQRKSELCDIEKAIGTTLPRVVLPNFDHGTHEHVPPPLARAEGRGRRRGSSSPWPATGCQAVAVPRRAAGEPRLDQRPGEPIITATGAGPGAMVDGTSAGVRRSSPLASQPSIPSSADRTR